MKKVATYRPPEPCKDCGGLHFGSARCPYLERTGPCEICDTDTVYACSDCAIDFKGRVVRVCTNPNCRDRHEEKTHASTIRGSRMNTQPLAEMTDAAKIAESLSKAQIDMLCDPRSDGWHEPHPSAWEMPPYAAALIGGGLFARVWDDQLRRVVWHLTGIGREARRVLASDPLNVPSSQDDTQ